MLARDATGPSRLVPKADGPLARYPAGHAEGYGDAFRNVFAEVYKAVAGEPHGPFPTFADGLRGVQAVEAAVTSAHSGRWTAVA